MVPDLWPPSASALYERFQMLGADMHQSPHDDTLDSTVPIEAHVKPDEVTLTVLLSPILFMQWFSLLVGSNVTSKGSEGAC
jgi:hypothetical protein